MEENSNKSNKKDQKKKLLKQFLDVYYATSNTSWTTFHQTRWADRAANPFDAPFWTLARSTRDEDARDALADQAPGRYPMVVISLIFSAAAMRISREWHEQADARGNAFFPCPDMEDNEGLIGMEIGIGLEFACDQIRS